MQTLVYAPPVRVRDTKVDADAIHRQNGLNLSVGIHKAGALLWGNLASCGRLAIGRTQRVPPAFAPDSGGSQPPRRLPASPTSRQRFYSYVVHPFDRVLKWMGNYKAVQLRSRWFSIATQVHLADGLFSAAVSGDVWCGVSLAGMHMGIEGAVSDLLRG